MACMKLPLIFFHLRFTFGLVLLIIPPLGDVTFQACFRLLGRSYDSFVDFYQSS